MYLQFNCNRVFCLSVKTVENLAKNDDVRWRLGIDALVAAGLSSGLPGDRADLFTRIRRLLGRIVGSNRQYWWVGMQWCARIGEAFPVGFKRNHEAIKIKPVGDHQAVDSRFGIARHAGENCDAQAIARCDVTVDARRGRRRVERFGGRQGHRVSQPQRHGNRWFTASHGTWRSSLAV